MEMASQSIDGPADVKTNDGHSLKFYPEDKWGLDFCFQTYNKMYICDVLSVEEYPIFPGAYMYKNHPIYKVDVIGVVVRIDQNSKCFIYEIDDGTGVISCSCWKMSYMDQYHTDVGSNVVQLPVALQYKFAKMQTSENTVGYSLGNLIHIRGKMNTFRNKKQIIAAYHRIVTDPMAEVFRMMELTKLYRMKYDKPFELPWKVAKEIQKGPKSDSEQIKTADMKEIKVNLCRYLQLSKTAEINSSILINIDSIQPYLECFTDVRLKLKYLEESLISLEDDGYLCRRIDKCNVFEVLYCDCDLDKTILKILREECSKDKYMDKGCHYLHVLDMLHRTYQYSNINKQCVIFCLGKLEEQSEVIRCTSCHYLPITT